MAEATSITKRGRPKGPSDPNGAIRQWQPKKWIPLYERVVYMTAMGFPASYIADQCGITTVHVSNINNCEQGRAYHKLIVESIRTKTTGELTDRLSRLQDLALSRVENTLMDEALYNENKLAITDRALRLLEKQGVVKSDSDNGNNVINNTINNISIENINMMGNAIEKAMEARKLYEASRGDAIEVKSIVRRVNESITVDE